MGDENKMKLNRQDLPIEVSNEIWGIFEKVQEINPISIEIDPSRQNNTVSKNVLAQFGGIPSQFEIYITIYVKDQISQDLLAHEILHAYLIVNGFPFFYRNNFPEIKTINNLENLLQHVYVFQNLEEMGFEPQKSAQESWEEGVEILKNTVSEIPDDAPTYAINTIGAMWTLEGLMAGINITDIKSKLPARFHKTIPIGGKLLEELQKYDLSKQDDSFQAHLKIAKILGLTDRDAFIGILDFKEHKRSYYSINTGNLLITK